MCLRNCSFTRRCAMQSTQRPKRIETTFSVEGSEPLAQTVYAVKGTHAELVFVRLQGFIRARQQTECASERLNLQFVLVEKQTDIVGEGLVLVSTPGKS